MRRGTFAWLALLIAAGCVEVPDTIKADFAAPGPAERSNYRPGAHGAARPAEEPAPKLATTADAGEAPTDPGDAQ
ncbi:MAG TPA: hypothetical protein VIF62_15840 [Labilithrix sp.]|jgi:hypothetical protein